MTLTRIKADFLKLGQLSTVDEGMSRATLPRPLLGDAFSPDAVIEVEALLRRQLRPHGWVRSVEVATEPEALPAPGPGDHARLRVPVEAERVWAQIVWEPGDGARDALVRQSVELVGARIREEAWAGEQLVLRDRLAALRQRMVERNRMAALGTMAASVAHDIRTPLTVLFANLSYLEEALEGLQTDDSEELRSVLDDNRLAVELIEGVLDSMKTFVADGEAAGLVRVEQVVASAVRLTRWHFGNAQVHVEPRVEGDPLACGTVGEVCQILVNLLANAAEASPRGSLVRVLARRAGEMTSIFVVDEGPGVPRRHRDAIFEAFHTTKAAGMGLGLSIAREMARRHGGELALLDAPPPELDPAPIGACFELRLPASLRATLFPPA